MNHEILWNVLIAKQLPAVAEEVRSLTSLTQLNLRFDQLTTASDKRMKSSMRLFLHILHLAFCILHKCNFMISKLSFYHNFFIVAILLHGLSLMRYDCRKSSSLSSCPLATQYCRFFAPHRAITLVGETFVARLIYYCPIHSFWPGDILLQPGYNHYCQSIITEKF